MKFINLLTIGIFITLLGIAMALWGMHMFTYRGDGCTQLMSETGKYSFLLCIPTFMTGLVLTGIGIGQKIASTKKKVF